VSDGVLNVASAVWHVIESSKPSASLASNTCNAVPTGIGDPMHSLTHTQGPNSVPWSLVARNSFGDVVDIAFDLRWDFGARHDGRGAYIPNCYLYVPRCSVGWGFDVDVRIHVHPPTNVGTERAPVARLPLTIGGAVSTMVAVRPVQWDFVLFGDGSYEAG
jgi:hypothetical protein